MSLRSRRLGLALLAAVTISCNDTITGPVTVAPDGAIVLGDSVLTRGAVVRASVEAPVGYVVVPGSVQWEVSDGSATFVQGGATVDSVDFSLRSEGALQLTARYRVRGQAGAGSSVTIVGPSSRSASDVRIEATRTVQVAAPTLEYEVVPPASVTAGTSLGEVRVALKDVRGRLLTGLTDSVVIALDPASGTSGATLLGPVRGKAVAGIATFSGQSIQRAGVGYRLIALSPTTASRDTALTTVVAGAPNAAQSTFTVTDTILSVGAGTTVIVTLRDQYGNPVLSATPAAFTPTKTDGTLGAFTCTNGVCTATYTAPTVPGGQTLGATIGGTAIPGAPRPVDIRAGAAARLKITGDTTQVAGATNLIIVTAFDAFGNVATAYTGAKRLTFSGASLAPIGTAPKIGAADLATTVELTFENGVARLVSSVLVKAERAVLDATDGTIAATGDDRLPVRVAANVPDGAQSTIVIADSARVGGQTTVVTITLRDAFGNPVLNGSADSFTPTVSGGTLSAFTCTLGVCTATYTAPPANGPQTITASIGGTPVVPEGTSTVQVSYDNVAPAIAGPSGAAGDAETAKTIPENTTAVHAFTANESVTWGLDGGEDAARFTLSAAGVLTFTAAPDFETPTDGASNGSNTYIVVVTATDSTGNRARQTVTITVSDLDDTKPAITGPSGASGDATSATSVPENTTAVHAFVVTEPVTWSLAGEDAARFTIDGNGVLTFVTAPDFEAPVDADGNNVYVVVITAVDAAGNVSTQTLTVTVTNADDTAPAITGPSGAAGDATSAQSVVENTTAVHGFVASEPVTWSLDGGADAARFSIDAAGTLTFVTAPDFETPADANRDNVYLVVVKAVDAAGNVTTQTLTVTVTDADEVAPVITGPSGIAGQAANAKSLPENTVAVHTFTANEGVTWSLSGVDAARFAIDPATGALTFAPAPDFERPADADANNVYLVTVTATDAAGNVATQVLTITITNLDESFPRITGPSGAAGDAATGKDIPENTTSVHRFTASEEVTWGLDGGEDAAKFAIDPVTGTLVFKVAPDFEGPSDADTNNRYVVIVSAIDPAGNVSRQTVAVTVTDVDEIAPVVTGPSGGAGAPTSTKSLPENTVAVYTFTASEPVTWRVDGGADGALFAIDPATGALTFVAAPDFENPSDAGRDNTYVVTIKATDTAGNVTTQTLTVTITNVDETAPRIQGPSGAEGAVSSTKSIPEGTTAVHSFSANEDATWGLGGGADATRFAINPFTGALILLAAPDFEVPTDADQNNTYVVIVTATDPAGNVAQQTVTVTVTDVDEVGALIQGPSGAAGAATSTKSIPENTTAVHTFTANEPVTWTLTGGQDQAKFAIDAATGALTFVAAPDFETPTDGATSGTNTYLVSVTATDATGNAAVQTVTVTVTDADEVAALIQGPSGAAGDATSAKSFPENSTAIVHTFTANEPVTWTLTGGQDQAKFAIDGATGALTFVAAPDFETPTDGATSGTNTYLVSVTATDAAGNAAVQTVTVTVTDVDEVAPLIAGPSGAAGATTSAKNVPENSTAVHTFTANEPVTWSVDGGADAARFAIDPATGALTFLAAPDFENPSDTDGNNTYVVVIKAVDALGNPSTQTVTVTITNVDERAPVITGPSGGAGAATSAKSIPENTTAVHTFTSDDADQVWGIEASGDGALFAISPTGALTFRSAPDFENAIDQGAGAGNNTYVVVVTATDPAGNVSRQTVTVTVTDVDEVAPEITGPSGAAGSDLSGKLVDEGTTAVHVFTANEAVTWSLDGGADASRFEIDAVTGALRFLAAPDFENALDLGDGVRNNTYVVVVRATDLRLNSALQTVTVTVVDVDDTPPSISGPSGVAGAATSAKEIPENSTAVHTFTANEAVTWSIVVGSPDAGQFAIDASGALRFQTAPDFENPLDNAAPALDNRYVVGVRAVDGAGNPSEQTVTVTVLDVNETGPPVITGPGGVVGAATSATSIPENTTLVGNFSTNKPAATWSLNGGADVARFSIGAATGTLVFNSAPDFETALDLGATAGNNTYVVVVRASDVDGANDQTVTVTVTDVRELALEGSAQAQLAIGEISERILFTVKEGATTRTVLTPTTFSLSSNGVGGSFFSDVDGLVPISSVTLDAGASAFQVYFRQTGGSAGSRTTVTATRTSGDQVAVGSVGVDMIAITAAATRLAGIICTATTGNSNDNTLAASGPCTATAGQLLVMVMGHSPTANPYTMPSFATPTGWTLLRTEGPVNPEGTVKNLRSYVFYRRVTSAGDYAVTFSTGTGGQAPKVRMSYVIVAVNDPNVTAPIDANSVAVTLTPTAGIRVPTTTATTNGSVLLAYAMQDIGGTSLTAPAGLATVGVFDNGGQQVSIGLFSKDRIFSGATPNYSVGTRETANPSIGGSIILRPQ